MRTQQLKPKMKSAREHERNGHPRAADIVINGSVQIPGWVTDLDSFRHWALSDDFPVRGRFAWLAGKLWLDLSMETLIHNQIKGCIAMVLSFIAQAESLGRYLGDRMMLAHAASDLSCEPDGMFITNSSFESGLVTLDNGNESLEIIGSPDMTLEVISASSIPKDTVTLKLQYAKAGIREYWLVDSTIETPGLIIMRLTGGKYVAARKHDGWVKSHVFGRSFRLTCENDANGLAQFNLETK